MFVSGTRLLCCYQGMLWESEEMETLARLSRPETDKTSGPWPWSHEGKKTIGTVKGLEMVMFQNSIEVMCKRGGEYVAGNSVLVCLQCGLLQGRFFSFFSSPCSACCGGRQAWSSWERSRTHKNNLLSGSFWYLLYLLLADRSVKWFQMRKPSNGRCLDVPRCHCLDSR